METLDPLPNPNEKKANSGEKEKENFFYLFFPQKNENFAMEISVGKEFYCVRRRAIIKVVKAIKKKQIKMSERVRAVIGGKSLPSLSLS